MEEINNREQFLKIRTYLENKLVQIFEEKQDLQKMYYENTEMLREHINSCKHSSTEYYSENFNTCSICGKILKNK